MTAESSPPHGNIHVGDVSGTFIVGDDNHVTHATHAPEQAQPEPRPQQRNSAADQAAVFSVAHGTMHVTYTPENAALAAHAAHPEHTAPEPAEEPGADR
ncbi:hypothetical protein SAMN05216223_105475 [Actinacidiphila yanglinensis]|uniref:Uncharacterized protein n=1 Tax=Actinacidiphila yanglinensis TaxID=310779 RepID=A0A1H6AKI6_9ACTN|nr:hypothetical protein [Actinacidiphila yanglinensis]SEG49239.1 hypothetical protein SAMN05216223_105475 [Actinacidiphila yanglinensis]